VPDITRLNRIRKANPALHTHTNVTFYNAFNDNILYYGKPSREGDEMILVAVNLNPHGPKRPISRSRSGSSACPITVPSMSTT
jgi:starch synthase (maltosyl-transferring)